METLTKSKENNKLNKNYGSSQIEKLNEHSRTGYQPFRNRGRGITSGSILPSLLSEFFSFDNDLTQKSQWNTPAVNVKETNNSYEVLVSAPGVKKEDFKIEIEDNNTLTISCETQDSVEQQSNESTKTKFSRMEFNYQSFERSFTLPQDVNIEKIEAKYENGILKLNIPKQESSKTQLSRTIKIS